jgi:serine/threonine protein kinase
MATREDKTVIPQQRDAPELQAAPPESEDQDRSAIHQPASGERNEKRALAVGVHLADFEILDLICDSGLDIVYLAYDTQLSRKVALREYNPAVLAARVDEHHVATTPEYSAEIYRAGLKSFINEARLLAQLNHDSLVKVDRFWEANGTAYVVSPYYEGVTLRDALGQMATPPDEVWLRALLKPLIEALSVLHAAGYCHWNIAPDNILLLKRGEPLLLGLDTTRHVIGEMTQTLGAMLRSGYAPIELYGETARLKQGPWSDVYALAAVIYFAITGNAPPSAVDRRVEDNYVPLTTIAAGRYSEQFLRAIDHALDVEPKDRPQSVIALAESLGHAPESDGAECARAAATISTAASHSTSSNFGKMAALVAALAILAALWLSFKANAPIRQADTAVPTLHGEPGQAPGKMPAPPKPEND